MQTAVCTFLRKRKQRSHFCLEPQTTRLHLHQLRLYLFLNLSTRPPVSTSFCLPVKYGWHFEQISTLSSFTFLVVPVWNVLPQAHTTVTSWYCGWIPSFIFVLLTLFFIPTRASILREYDTKFLYYIYSIDYLSSKFGRLLFMNYIRSASTA